MNPPPRSDQRVQNVTNCWQRSQKLNLEWPIDQNVTGWPKCRQRVPRGAKLGSEGIKATKIGTAGTRGDKNWDQGWPREQKKEQLVRVDQVYQLLPGGTKLGSRVSKVSKIWPIVDSLVKSWIKVDQAHQNGTNCWQGGRNWYQGWPGYQSESWSCQEKQNWNLSWFRHLKWEQLVPEGTEIEIIVDQVGQNVTSCCQRGRNWDWVWLSLPKWDQLLTGRTNWGLWVTKLTKIRPTGASST
jgi:hypothetical protein